MRLLCARPIQLMPQEEMNLPIRRTKAVHAGEPTNLYIRPSLKRTGAIAARDRYGWSLSRLVNELLDRETKKKRGILQLPMIVRERS